MILRDPGIRMSRERGRRRDKALKAEVSFSIWDSVPPLSFTTALDTTSVSAEGD